MILNLISNNSTIDAPFINFEAHTQYFLEIENIGAFFNLTTKNTFIDITCNAIDACYGLPYTVIMDGVCTGRSCYVSFMSQRSNLRFRLNTYNWRNTKFHIHFNDPKINVENFWLQIKITKNENNNRLP